MCSGGWDYRANVRPEHQGECPDCDEPCEVVVNDDGTTDYEPLVGCDYSPKTCETCGARPCDGGC